jgi:DNA invertase Pin-like site-specific DNA recombinase
MGSDATETRPKRQELLKAARQRKLEVMLVWKLDRWCELTA